MAVNTAVAARVPPVPARWCRCGRRCWRSRSWWCTERLPQPLLAPAVLVAPDLAAVAFQRSHRRPGCDGRRHGAAEPPPEQTLLGHRFETDSLSRTTGPSVVSPATTPPPAYVPLKRPLRTPLLTAGFTSEPPYLRRRPSRRARPWCAPSGKVAVNYSYELAGRIDQSLITWSICDDLSGRCRDSRDLAGIGALASSQMDHVITDWSMRPASS